MNMIFGVIIVLNEFFMNNPIIEVDAQKKLTNAEYHLS